jgi:hypothetical protein
MGSYENLNTNYPPGFEDKGIVYKGQGGKRFEIIENITTDSHREQLQWMIDYYERNKEVYGFDRQGWLTKIELVKSNI